MKVKIKKTHPEAVIPKYATQGSAGFDLAAIEDTIIEPGETVLVRTGLAFEIPEGYEMQVRPRSGMSITSKLRVILGTIDSDYRGEIKVIVESRYQHMSYTICKGERIAQAVLAPIVQADFEEVDELSGTERGVGGFGSTGTKAE